MPLSKIDSDSLNTPITAVDLAYTGTLTGGTGVVNLGSGQVYKDASGNVGIGTAVPFSNLSIVGETGIGYQQIKLRQTNTAADQRTGIAFAEYATGTQGFGIGAFSDSGVNRLFIGGGANGMNSATEIRFATTSSVGTNTGTERARIDSSGNLLVGKTTATTTEAGTWLNANIADGYGRINFVKGTASGTGATSACGFYYNGSQVGSITTSSTATAYNTSSDYRLKEAIAPMTGALAKVALLKPCVYKWKVDGSDGQGFIAHELQEVEAGCVTGEKDAVDAEGNPQYQGIDTSFLVATLTAAIQELKAIVDAQGAEIAALKGTP